MQAPAVRAMWSADPPCSPPAPKAHGRSMVRKRLKLFIGMAAASAVVLSSGMNQAAQAAQLNSAVAGQPALSLPGWRAYR